MTDAVSPPDAWAPWRWYFAPRPLLVVTAPLALWLVYCIALSSFGAVVLWWSSARAAWAVGGFGGAALSVTFLAILYGFPPVAYVQLFGGIPATWQAAGPASRKLLISAGLLVAISVAASLGHLIGVRTVGWIADRDPCASFAAGVTGSRAPVDCPSGPFARQ
jgi:hypothetical protein